MRDDFPNIRAPQVMRHAYSEWSWDKVWSFEPHTITYRLSRPDHVTRYLKLARQSWYPSPAREAARMRWARQYLPVPPVLESGTTERVEWLLTEAMPGVPATDPDLLVSPERLVELLAAGLLAWHRVPIATCPFDFRLEAAIAHVAARIEDGHVDAERDFHPEHQHLSVHAAFEQLERTRPQTEDLVVCHGDYCLPNVLIDEGRVAGFVDLGEVGVADRWWDLAVATWSLEWNLGTGYEKRFLEAYGTEMDRDRLVYYRLLYDMVS